MWKIKNWKKYIIIGLNEINNINYEELLKSIEYYYYSKRYSNAKTESKRDNKGIKLIKEFLLTMYKKFGAVINKEMMSKKLVSLLIIFEKLFLQYRHSVLS